MTIPKIKTPLDDKKIGALRSGDEVFISGIIYAARDAAHKRLIESLDKKENLPFDLKGQVIYFVGPSPHAPVRQSGLPDQQPVIAWMPILRA